MSNLQIYVDSYNVRRNDIHVSAIVDGETMEFLPTIKEFEDFIDDFDKRDWCEDYNDPNDDHGHGQRAGKYSMDEIYDTPDKMKEIMAEYIQYCEDQESFDIQPAIRKITNQHKKIV